MHFPKFLFSSCPFHNQKSSQMMVNKIIVFLKETAKKNSSEKNSNKHKNKP